MEQTPFAQLSDEKLDEINALQDKLGVILVAYDFSTGSSQFAHDQQSSEVINPS
ncbi:MAG: hypothetical protein ACI33P_01875 [Lysinibacillus sp.]